jgi:hypothetical protein
MRPAALLLVVTWLGGAALADPPPAPASDGRHFSPLTPPSETTTRRLRYAGAIAMAIVSAGAIAGGLGLALPVDADYQSLKRRCAPRCDPSSWADLQAREQGGIALGVIGGVAALVDVVLWVALRRTPPRTPAGGVAF